MAKNTNKQGVFEGLRKTFFPTAREMVDQMTGRTAYPSGRAHWQISKKIAGDKTLDPQEKLDLLVEMYAKYYLYQHSKFVTFAVYEDHYEDFISTQKVNGKTMVYRNQGRFEKLYNERLSEQEYIVNRELRETAAKILRGAGMTAHQIQDGQTRDIVLMSLRLQDDYHDRLTFNVYCPSREENELKEQIIAKYEQQHPTEARSIDPLNTLTQDIPVSHMPVTGKYETPRAPQAAPAPYSTEIKPQFKTPTESKDKSLEQ